jgi:hypothetical protein
LHHCNIAGKAALPRQVATALAGPSPALASSTFRLSCDDDDDDDEMDGLDEHEEMDGMYVDPWGDHDPYRRRGCYESDSYDDSEGCPYSSTADLDEDLYLKRNQNPWVYRNPDVASYTFSTDYSLVDMKEKPSVKLSPLTVTEATLAQCAHIGDLELPLKVCGALDSAVCFFVRVHLAGIGLCLSHASSCCADVSEQEDFVQLQGVTVAEIEKSFAKAPYGYKDVAMFEDWRSWEGFFGKEYCLCSIALQQTFPTAISCVPSSALTNRRAQLLTMGTTAREPSLCVVKGINLRSIGAAFHVCNTEIFRILSAREECCCQRSLAICRYDLKAAFAKLPADTKAPVLPKASVCFESLPPLPSDPSPPPVDYVLRACLFVDCYQPRPLMVLGLKTRSETSVVSLRKQIAQSLGLPYGSVNEARCQHLRE